MLEEIERKKLTKEIDSFSKDVFNLRKTIREINEKKEFWYSKKEALRKEVKGLIQKIKNLKRSSDDKSSNINVYRDKREEFNKEVKKLIKEIKNLNTKKKELLKKSTIKDPNKIKNSIDKLEESVEIEAYSFDKEQKVMKKIKDLKKIYEENKETKELLDDMDRISKRIEENRNKSQEFHQKFIDSIKGNKNVYNEFTDLSKKISTLNKEQEKAFEKYIKIRKKYQDLNLGLEEKTLKLKILMRKSKDDKLQRNRLNQEKQKTKVEEKLKSKKTLTTEDIISFQIGEKLK
tara:strand:- start:13686 stop:14555 length:870 start_codon:yes stop_codon:yes gene_type:complete